MNNFKAMCGKYFDLDGLNYHYIDEGSGDPVVMIHGNPSWSIYYRHLVSALKEKNRCIVVDHIGCGLSDKPSIEKYDYRLKSRVDNLDCLLDHLNTTDNITLVVHDWGGMIGMNYATRYPERIKRLVVLNTSAFRLPDNKKLPLGLWICRNTILGKLLVRGGNAFARGAAWVGCKRNKMSKQMRDAYCKPYDSWRNRIATHLFVKDIPLSAADPSWSTVIETENGLDQFVDTPMLICWGMKDFCFDERFLKLWQAQFPKAQVELFDDCGHYILEDATDEVIAHIESFININPIKRVHSDAS